MQPRNPYVGPRTFQRDEGHLFFGREHEARDLIALVSTERLVVFYAQSGAGKSSIVNTRLLLALEESNYEVLPVGRVSGAIAAGIAVDNIYVYNLIRSLEQHDTEPTTLVSLSLPVFLAHLNFDEKGFFYDPSPVETIPEEALLSIGRRALIIDQFEELFSTYPESWEKREDFFKQLGQAMRDDPLLWVVLVMREDYIAALDAYAHYASNGLRARYYMQRLEHEAALQSIKSPVQDMRPFAEGVAEKLIDDLRSIKVQKPDGSLDLQPGQYIEPVQLQVVCYGLWENLPSEGKQITEKDLQDVGDVNQSLGKYYDRRVEEVARSKNVKQRLIREWFEKKLITAGGIRNMVLQEREKKSGELDDEVIRALQSDLVRAEKRGGATWYELTHDRLVEPILERNKIWFNENLSPLQRQAALWKDQGQNETWLLSDQALADVEEWAKIHEDELTDIETDFLEECRTKQKEKEERLEFEAQQQKFLEAQKLGRRRRIVTSISIVVALLMAFLTLFGLYQSRQAGVQAKIAGAQANIAETQAQLAESAKGTAAANSQLAQAAEAAAIANAQQAQEQTRLALSSLLSTQSNALREKNFQISILLGIEAFRGVPSLQSLGAILNAAQANPRLHQYLNGHSSNVLAVAFSSDGKTLASASFDKTIILWDVETGQPIGKPLTGHTDAINSISFSPDGKTLASGSSDKTIILWDVKTHEPIGDPLLGHADSVFSVNYGSDGKTLTLASGSTDNTIIVWDVSDPLRPRQIRQITNVIQAAEGGSLVTTLAVSPSGRFLVSGTRTKMRLWAVRTGQAVGTLPQETSGFITSVGFSPDSKILASGNSDGSISLWSVEFSQPMRKLLQWQAHSGPVSSVAFSSDGKTLASGSYDNTVMLWEWDRATSRPIAPPLQGHTGPVSSVAFSPDGKTLASGSYDSTIIVWDVEPQPSIGNSPKSHSGSVLSLAFNTDAKTLASGSADKSIILWDVATHRPTDKLLQGQTGPVLSLAISPDGKTIASGSEDNNILLWDIASHQPIGIPLEGHAGPVSNVVFSPDGKSLASASADKTIILWDITSFSKLATLSAHSDAVLSVAFSPDGKRLASGSSDNTVIIWDVSDPTAPSQLATLAGHTAEVSSVAFSTSGKTLASGSFDNTIILWDLDILQRIGDPLIGHKGAINALAFNPDEKTLASGSADNTIIHIIQWDLDPTSWLEKSCQRVGRNFTVAEWTQYFPNEKYRKTCEQWPLGLKINAAPDGNPAMGTATIPPDVILYGVITLGGDATCLNVRAGPGTKYDVIACIPKEAHTIQITGEGIQVNDKTWVPVVFGDITGWVNSQYLMPQKSEQ